MQNYNVEKILKIHHWNNRLFTIISTRNKNFKFKNGEFVLLGLKNNNSFIYRAYSITSSNYDNFLEFLSIKIQDGLFTNFLKNLKINEEIFVSKKSYGTLLIENLLNNGKNLWMFSSGTGISPFISILKNFEIYKIYEKIMLVHTVNYRFDLCYRYFFNNIFIKNLIFFKKILFFYYPIVTKEYFLINKRITFILKNENEFKKNKNINFILNSKLDRIMICGNINLIKDLKEILENKYKFFESKSNIIGNYVTERAFVN